MRIRNGYQPINKFKKPRRPSNVSTITCYICGFKKEIPRHNSPKQLKTVLKSIGWVEIYAKATTLKFKCSMCIKLDGEYKRSLEPIPNESLSAGNGFDNLQTELIIQCNSCLVNYSFFYLHRLKRGGWNIENVSGIYHSFTCPSCVKAKKEPKKTFQGRYEIQLKRFLALIEKGKINPEQIAYVVKQTIKLLTERDQAKIDRIISNLNEIMTNFDYSNEVDIAISYMKD